MASWEDVPPLPLRNDLPDLRPADEPTHRHDPGTAYWVDRALTTQGVGAVLPAGRWLRYHAWTNALLHRFTLSRLDRRRFRRFVDLGCGRGEWTALFAERADEVHACDVALPFVHETRGRLEAIGHRASFVEQADIRDFRVPSGTDLAYLGAVLLYLPDPVALGLLRRLRAAMVRDGQLVIRDYCTFNFGTPSVNHVTGYSVHRRAEDVVALARDAGFRCREVRASPSIYAEVMGNRITRWPLRVAWRLATLHWLRASHTFVFRAG
ncbi:MAG TPA: class I SAM-dependent methyltransferase [Kofleriaceae bacterium]|nr:class I SAM-dependent methyltransferase [Kofleriaceae bacterium]